MLPIHDYRQRINLADHQEIPGYFIALCADATILYEWANFNHAPKHPKEAPVLNNWGELLNRIHNGLQNTPFTTLGCDGLFRPYNSNDLIIDSYRDSYKWGACRSIYSPETLPLLREALSRRQIDLQTRVFFGNWALADGVFEGTVADLLERDTQEVILYHGTSTYRMSKIQQNGLLPALPTDRVWKTNRKTANTVFLTPSLHRALYFTRNTATHDTKHLRRTKQKGKAAPLILQCRLRRDQTQFVADDDWRTYPHCQDPDSWVQSLEQFGQVGIQPSIPAEQLTPIQPQFRIGHPNFHLGVLHP